MEASVGGVCSADFAERVRINQSRLSSAMKSQYDFIICGSGSSGSVVARRLAENPEVSVLLVEAGGDDNVPSVNEPGQWFRNLGSERDWNFSAEPNPHLNGRVIPMNMGKVLGGGSSINLMAWMRGHRNDWDFFASEAADPAWSYESILGIIAGSKTGMACPTPTAVVWADRSSFSRHPIRIPSHPPHSKQRGRLEFQPSTARTDA
jgi:choline dehydrogenase